MIIINYTQLEKVFLIVLSIFGILYSFQFGLLLTAYPHGGQLLGVPFTIALIIYSCFIIYSKSQKVRQIFRIINYCYISSISLYVMTVTILKHIKGETAWEYLNAFNPPELSRNEKIFNAYAIAGFSICVILILGRRIKIKRQQTQTT